MIFMLIKFKMLLQNFMLHVPVPKYLLWDSQLVCL